MKFNAFCLAVAVGVAILLIVLGLNGGIKEKAGCKTVRIGGIITAECD